MEGKGKGREGKKKEREGKIREERENVIELYTHLFNRSNFPHPFLQISNNLANAMQWKPTNYI